MSGVDLDYQGLKRHLTDLIGKRCTVTIAAAHDPEIISSSLHGTLCHGSPERFRERMERDLGRQMGVESTLLGFEEDREALIVLWTGTACGRLQGYDSPKLVVVQAGMAISFDEHLTLNGP